MIIFSTDEDPCLRIESFAIMNLRGVSTKLNKCMVFTIDIGGIDRRLGSGGVTFLKSKMADASGQKKARENILPYIRITF